MRTIRKRFVFLFSTLFLSHLFYAQVGINTRNPQGVFHIDGKGDTNGNANVSDDVVVTTAGVGVGTNQPTATLDIRGKFKYVDGNQSSGYMLQTDGAGNAAWAPQAITSKGIRYANGVSNHDIAGLLSGKAVTTGAGSYVGVSITLPPGSWMITYCATFVLDRTGIPGNPVPTNIWWDLTYSSTARYPGAGRILSSNIGGFASSLYAPVNAAFFVTHTATTTYYIWGQSNNYRFTYSGEGYMWALKLLPR